MYVKRLIVLKHWLCSWPYSKKKNQHFFSGTYIRLPDFPLIGSLHFLFLIFSTFIKVFLSVLIIVVFTTYSKFLMFLHFEVRLKRIFDLLNKWISINLRIGFTVVWYIKVTKYFHSFSKSRFTEKCHCYSRQKYI